MRQTYESAVNMSVELRSYQNEKPTYQSTSGGGSEIRRLNRLSKYPARPYQRTRKRNTCNNNPARASGGRLPCKKGYTLSS